VSSGRAGPPTACRLRAEPAGQIPADLHGRQHIGRTHTALGAFYRRLAARTGKAKAVTATARKLAVLFYNALRFGMTYTDPGASYYEERYRQRALDNLRRRAHQLGFTLVAAPASQE
jgi:hypothetical protein